MKLELDYNDEKSDFRETNFPARYIYERLLPEVTAKYSDIYYHRSSPYSGFGQVTTDRTNGDLHQCKSHLPVEAANSLNLLFPLYRECLAWIPGAMAQLGHPRGTLCIRVWNVSLTHIFRM